MHRISGCVASLASLGLVTITCSVACGGATPGSGFARGGAEAEAGTFGGGDAGTLGGDSGPGGDDPSGAVACPAGLSCNVSCSGGATTTIKGKVYDPAGKNPLYNVAVYVPATPLQPLPRGVPTGQDACSCGALFRSGAVVNTTTGVDGSFTLTNAPVGTDVPLVLQVGKWRRVVHVRVTACQDNVQPDNSLRLPGSVVAGNTEDNIPDIAVSTGQADSLECLMLRVGIASSEYVAGSSTSGRVHVFSGGVPGPDDGPGRPEATPMPGAPASSTSLWASQEQLMPYDIVLLSCEGGETYAANPPALESYLNAGGRAFASHFQYSWFSGPLATTQAYSAPADWGSNLATWTGGNSNPQVGPLGGVLETTLNGSGTPFPKGVALQQWLANVNALGQNGVPSGQLSIYQPRYNASISPANAHSQPWITSNSNSMYFSFDTPVNARPAPDGGAPDYCGRAVFSDLHVSGDPATSDSSPPPGGCMAGDLSPQEKALEFMLFDLSSCVISDTITPGAPPLR